MLQENNRIETKVEGREISCRRDKSGILYRLMEKSKR